MDINKIEQQVTDLLNDEVKEDDCYSEAVDLCGYIERDLEQFGGVEEAEWTAKNHSRIGDLDVITGDGSTIHCELKVLSNTGGKGTLGNISQATFKEFKLFKDIKYSWKEYRNNKYNYDDKVLEILGKYEDYPENIKNMSDGTISKRAEMGRHLKDVLEVPRGKKVRKIAKNKKNSSQENVKKAAEIVIEITDFEAETRRGYIQYLKNLEQNKTNIKKLSILLLSGFKKQEVIKKHWGSEIKNISKNLEDKYRTYYCYENNVKNSTRAKTIKLLTKDTNYKFNFKHNRSLYVSSENHDKILTFSLNWKNVFQGIKTDSINVFSEI